MRVQKVQRVQRVQRVVVTADAADFKKAGPRPRHFDRSEAEWRNLPPSDGTGGITAGDLPTQSIMGAVTVCLPYRHAATLEMTVTAPPLNTPAV